MSHYSSLNICITVIIVTTIYHYIFYLFISVIGYVVIPQKWIIQVGDIFVYDSWRLYVFLCGLPSLIMGIVMIRMPESPRFLLLQGKLYQSRKVLELMFKVNTRKNVSDFPVSIFFFSFFN